MIYFIDLFLDFQFGRSTLIHFVYGIGIIIIIFIDKDNRALLPRLSKRQSKLLSIIGITILIACLLDVLMYFSGIEEGIIFYVISLITLPISIFILFGGLAILVYNAGMITTVSSAVAGYKASEAKVVGFLMIFILLFVEILLTIVRPAYGGFFFVAFIVVNYLLNYSNINDLKYFLIKSGKIKINKAFNIIFSFPMMIIGSILAVNAVDAFYAHDECNFFVSVMFIGPSLAAFFVSLKHGYELKNI